MITSTPEPKEAVRIGEKMPRPSKLTFWVGFASLTAVYFTCAWLDARRFVWFDELFTFDIARAPSLLHLWHWVLRFDNNPPAVYLLSRLSMAMFGATPFGLRLPSILEFYLGSVAIFMYVRRHLGDAVGGFVVLVNWASNGIFYYATEARPYALVFMGFAFLLFFWDRAAHDGERRFALPGIAAATAVLLSAHVFAPLSVYPFWAAEAVRFWRRRKPDYALWTALLVPSVTMLMYVPLIRAYGTIVAPPGTRASWLRTGAFFSASFGVTGKILLSAIAVFLLLPEAKEEERPSPKFRTEDAALFACLILNPLFLNAVLMFRHGGFFNRYCLTSYIAICIASSVFLSIVLRPNRTAIGVASLVLIAGTVHSVLRDLRLPRVDPIPWSSIRPDLPIVDSDGKTFYEMNHNEGPAVLSRLYYLEDRTASLRYEKTNFFQDFEAPDDMKNAGFPFTANIESYDSFVRSHREFLVFGSDQGWPMLLLHDEGATAQKVADYSHRTPYHGGSEGIWLLSVR